MTTDLHDTALPRFEDRLWDELSDLHRQRQEQRPAAITPHKPSRRRRPLGVGAAVAVVAATTLVVGIAVLPGGEPRRAEASAEEKVLAATEAAIADSVVLVTEDLVATSTMDDREIWYDATTASARVRELSDQGEVIRDGGPVRLPDPGDPTRTERRVQACDATFSETDEPAVPTEVGDLEVRAGFVLAPPGWWAAMAMPRTGGDVPGWGPLVEDGTEVIDGRELIRLRRPADSEPAPTSEQTLYVEPESYLPVELRSDVGGPDEDVVRFEYLPRTAANLALLTPPVPAGYTEVDQLTPC